MKKRYVFLLGNSETRIAPEGGIFQNTLEILIEEKSVYSTRADFNQALIQHDEGIRRVLETGGIDVVKWRGAALEIYENYKLSKAVPPNRS